MKDIKDILVEKLRLDINTKSMPDITEDNLFIKTTEGFVLNIQFFNTLLPLTIEINDSHKTKTLTFKKYGYSYNSQSDSYELMLQDMQHYVLVIFESLQELLLLLQGKQIDIYSRLSPHLKFAYNECKIKSIGNINI